MNYNFNVHTIHSAMTKINDNKYIIIKGTMIPGVKIDSVTNGKKIKLIRHNAILITSHFNKTLKGPWQ